MIVKTKMHERKAANILKQQNPQQKVENPVLTVMNKVFHCLNSLSLPNK